MCSFYEFLYSYRNSTESPFPDLNSKDAIDALEKLEKIKNNISNGEYIQILKL